MAKHTLSVKVKNHAGVLSKVTGLFSRRGFNIESLAVGETNEPGKSRITLVVNADEHTVEQISKQLEKLVDVEKVKRLDAFNSVSREIVLVKVKADKDKRSEIIQLVDIFRGNIIDVSTKTLTIEITGDIDKTDAFLKMLSEFGIIELARTGIVALERGRNDIND